MKHPKPSQCRHLRTKMTYVPDQENAENWRMVDSTTRQYWCLCTMSTAGPDNDLVTPEQCQSQRSCYKEVDLIV
ncbi:MAG: hypothetical protein ACE5HS_18040 [bacterium]